MSGFLPWLWGGAVGALAPSLAASLRAGAPRTAIRDGSRAATTLMGGLWGGACALVFPSDLFGPAPMALAIFSALPMLAIALVDIRERIIHDIASLGLGLCLLSWRWTLEGAPWAALAGGALAFLGAETLRRLYRRLRAREGLGTGDVGVIAAAGMALSLSTLAPFLVVAGGVGGVWGLISARLFRRDSGGEPGLPFAPALMMGLALAILLAGLGKGGGDVLFLSKLLVL